MANQTLNPFSTTPKETKKQVDQIGGKMGFFDETENDFRTTRFVSQEHFNIEPAAAIAENVIYGEYLGSLDINGSAKTFIEQRDINIPASDQKVAFAGLFSAGTDVLKDASTKAASTIANLGIATADVVKDTVAKDILGFGVKQEKPKTPEEIKKANEDAAQRAHEQKFWANLPVHQTEVNMFELDNKVVSGTQLEEALGIKITADHINAQGKLKAGKEAEGKKALDDKAKQQQAATQKANTLVMATKGKGLGKGELDKGAENPSHFTKAVG